MRPAFKKIGNKLAFNNPGAEPIFLIIDEKEAGYLYFLETTPFGTVNFVHRDLVELDEDVEEKANPGAAPLDPADLTQCEGCQ